MGVGGGYVGEDNPEEEYFGAEITWFRIAYSFLISPLS